MTTKRKPTPYVIPTAWKGDTLVKAQPLLDKAFDTALRELAAEEHARWGSQHGIGVVMMNVTLRNTKYFQEKRSQLRKRYNELKQQEKHQREEEHPEVAAEFQ
ncbi:hypothetical protein ACFUPZ_00125 [Microbacterium oxydans]|uniref:hypothetical protein n=1 Tax=Microbacterium oxydans TaxID=82380 RepID=UPI003629E9F8